MLSLTSKWLGFFSDCELPLYRSDIPKYSKGHDSMMHKAALRQGMHVFASCKTN